MQYRQFGQLDLKVSALGFGVMRLPMLGESPDDIDEPLAIEMIRHAIDSGVNYVDTAYPYHNGLSEPLLGRALADGYRDKVKIATKSPTWFLKSPDDFDRYLDEQLKRLNTDHIDIYLLHSLNKHRWPPVRDMGITEEAEKAIKDGRIGHFGFSFHDDLEAFKGIVDDYDGWSVCQIQYNFMDTEYQAGKEGLQYAAAKGLAMVVMEPVDAILTVAGLPDNLGEADFYRRGSSRPIIAGYFLSAKYQLVDLRAIRGWLEGGYIDAAVVETKADAKYGKTVSFELYTPENLPQAP